MAAYMEEKFSISQDMSFTIMDVVVFMSSKDAESTERLITKFLTKTLTSKVDAFEHLICQVRKVENFI